MLRHRIWSYATSLSAALVGGHSRSRFSVMPSFIITLEIVIWYGAVIAQSGRQFDESGVAFSESLWYNDEVRVSTRLARVNRYFTEDIRRCI